MKARLVLEIASVVGPLLLLSATVESKKDSGFPSITNFQN
jgi:hypothetical protein